MRRLLVKLTRLRHERRRRRGGHAPPAAPRFWPERGAGAPRPPARAPLTLQRSVRENKTIALSIAIVSGGAVYSLYKKLSAEGRGQEVSTITRVVRRDRILVDRVFLRRCAARPLARTHTLTR